VDGKCTIDVISRDDSFQVTQSQIGYYAR